MADTVFKPISRPVSQKLIADQYVQNNITPEQKLLDALRGNLTLKETIRITGYSLASGDTVADGNPVQLLQGGDTPIVFASTSTSANESSMEFSLPMLIKMSSLIEGFELAVAGASTNYFAVDIFNVNNNAFVEVFKENQDAGGNLRSIAIINDLYTSKFRYRWRVDNGNTLALYPMLLFI